MAQSEPSFSQWRRSDSSSEFRPKPHAKFPEKIQIEFTASGGHSYKATASLLWQQFNEHSTITAKTTINGTETFEHFVPVLRSYHGETSDGHPVSVVLHDEEGSFHMVIVTDEGHFTVEPHSRHENSISHSETRRALASAVKDTGLVLFFGKDVNEELYDSQPISDNNKLTREAIKRHIIPNSIKRNLRERRVVSKWAGCFPGADTNIYTITVGIAVNAGFYQVMGSSTANVLAIISEIFAAANVIYKTQVGVFLIVGPIDIRTTLDSDSTWNQIPSTSGTASCSGTIDTHLNGFTSWRAAKPKTETNAIWHLLTNCYPAPGTVGYAGVGVLCNSNSGTGWSSYTTQTWLTVTHEIGHNFGAQHTFNLGGIMDYGDGLYLGEYQFYSPQNQNEICTHISNTMKASTSTSRVQNCWKVYSPTCGNSNVEAGEQCDDTSACCSGCKFTSGSECSNHPCCNSCKFALPTTRCYQNTGYCANSTCVTSGCSQYSNVKPCGVTSSNPCLEGCVFDGSTTCSPATSISSLTRKYVPVGTVCSRSPYSTCQPSGTGSTITCQSSIPYAWVAGTFGSCSVTCGTGTQTRTVTCTNSNTGATVDSSLCTGTKPATTQSCTQPACTTYSWATGTFGTCSVPCGTGTQTRTVTCVMSSTSATVADSFCTTTKPALVQSCTLTACAWVTGTFSACSAVCGGGTQTRTVTCVTNAGSGTTVSNSYCTKTKPATSQICGTAACATYNWKAAEFGTCTGACGFQTQTRTVQCITTASGAVVVDSLCTSTKPATSQSCYTTECGPIGGEQTGDNAGDSGGGGSIVPIIIGVVIGLLVLVAIIVVVLYRRRRSTSSYLNKHERSSKLKSTTGSQDAILSSPPSSSIPSYKKEHHVSVEVAPVQTNVLAVSSNINKGNPFPNNSPAPKKPRLSFLGRSKEPVPEPPVAAPEVGEMYRALYDYTAHQADELNIRAGDVVHVTSVSEDGWMLGKNSRTKNVGVCPGNYLTKIETATAPKPVKPSKAPIPTGSNTNIVSNTLFSTDSSASLVPSKPAPSKPTKVAPSAPSAASSSSTPAANKPMPPPGKPAPNKPLPSGASSSSSSSPSSSSTKPPVSQARPAVLVPKNTGTVSKFSKPL